MRLMMFSEVNEFPASWTVKLNEEWSSEVIEFHCVWPSLIGTIPSWNFIINTSAKVEGTKR